MITYRPSLQTPLLSRLCAAPIAMETRTSSATPRLLGDRAQVSPIQTMPLKEVSGKQLLPKGNFSQCPHLKFILPTYLSLSSSFDFVSQTALLCGHIRSLESLLYRCLLLGQFCFLPTSSAFFHPHFPRHLLLTLGIACPRSVQVPAYIHYYPFGFLSLTYQQVDRRSDK